MISFRVCCNNRPDEPERDGEIIDRITSVDVGLEGQITVRYVDLEGDRCSVDVPLGSMVQVYH